MTNKAKLSATNTAFGYRLRSLRPKKITLASMAKIVGVTTNIFHKSKQVKSPSSPAMVDQICAILGLIWDDAEELKDLAFNSKTRVTIDTTHLGLEATVQT